MRDRTARAIVAAVIATLAIGGAAPVAAHADVQDRAEASVRAAAQGDDVRGYRLYASDGGVFTFGDLPFQGSLGEFDGSRAEGCYSGEGGSGVRFFPDCEDAAAHPDGNGYWLVDGHCAVFAFGSARDLGQPSTNPESNVIGAPVGCSITATPSGNGYWLMDGTGLVDAYGDAVDLGEGLNIEENREAGGAADITATTTGDGYWILGARGGVYPRGDATDRGDVAQMVLNQRVTGMVADPDGTGYWITAYDGGVFSFDAPFYGSTGGLALNAPVNGLAVTPDGKGYWLVADDGGVFAFGDAPFLGSMGGTRLVAPVIGMLAS